MLQLLNVTVNALFDCFLTFKRTMYSVTFYEISVRGLLKIGQWIYNRIDRSG